MKQFDTYTCEPLSEEPQLPREFTGGFERITNQRSGDVHTDLYVFMNTNKGGKAYVNTFSGPFPQNALDKFYEWYWSWREHDRRLST